MDHIGSDAAPIQMLLNSALAGTGTVGLGRGGSGSGSRGLAPVVQNFWNVKYTAGFLHYPQKQVVILAAVETRAESAYLVHQLLSVYAEMTHVVTGQQILW